ncbi:hypothetical protein [uncultured Massilia sp.]|uniref:hypothetical protein n=1 Tax=uncultured Massilia sp. TaxID=169973 RepID=UPI00258B4A41|nr:hypothetical protein [uncultured Massilia sp.]
MNSAGPALETLTRRLLDTPAEFLDEPRIDNSGTVAVPALVHDLMRLHGHRAPARWLDGLGGAQPRARRNRLAVMMVLCWLLADEWFLAQGLPRDALYSLFENEAGQLAQATPAHNFVQETGAGEELVRVALAHFGYRPADESLEQAQDRLAAVSAAARRRLLDASRAAEKRAREVREALARKAAEESADKWTRE